MDLRAVLIFADDHARPVGWISVGDPRGAFCMTLELIKHDGDHKGELRLSVPYPGESLPHMELTQLGSQGYYKVR